jgi:hypothetical protein
VTIYVDNYRVPAQVGQIRGRWSHLTADTPAELHTFADRLGLRRAWFQARCRATRCPSVGGACVHFHYDVTDRVRDRAIGLGATAIDIRDFGALITARRGDRSGRPAGNTPDMFLPAATSHEPVPRYSAPGLGIVPDINDGTGLLRYSIVHLGSGLAVFGCVTARCSEHVHQAVTAMGASGIDWQQPAATLKTDQRLDAVRRALLTDLVLCFDPETAKAIRCLGDQPSRPDAA